MCRIYGFVSDGLLRLDQRMDDVLRAQVHGGPDGQIFYAKPTYGIGANRLAIMDPKGGAQPYHYEETIYAALNGEIYNHDALRAELIGDGYRFDNRCDGSILPALYHKYGAAFAEYLDGMFTVAILDLRAGKPHLLLASDGAGIKPLYYTYRARQNAFAFATEVPALLKFGVASGSVWMPGVDHYLTTRTVVGPRTILNDVYSLPPGSVLQIREGEEPLIRTYASRIRYEGPAPKSVSEAGDIFRGLMTQEVKRLSKADARVCTVNSGGLDSSLVTTLNHQAMGGNTSFHVACEGTWPFDERAFARELAEAYGSAYHEAILRPSEMASLIPDMVYHLGVPNCAPHALSTLRLFEAVSEAGFRVALTGEGSDELFCGHGRMINAVRSESDEWISDYLDGMSPCTQATRRSLYNRDYVHALSRTGGFARDQVATQIQHSTDNRSLTVRMFEQRNSLPFYILHRVEPLAMASGVEVRVPFCQPRIRDFARRLDPALLLSGESRGKAVVYAAAEGLVPRSILDRPKQPFTLPVVALMHEGSELMAFAKEQLYSRRMTQDSPFDAKGIHALISRQQARPDKESAFTMWALTVYSVWADMVAEMMKTDSRGAMATAQPASRANIDITVLA